MRFEISTKGHYDFKKVTELVAQAVEESGAMSGSVVCFVPGSTVGLTTMEWEEGIQKDLVALYEKMAPEDADYKHHEKWGDHNGAAHMKSALMGTSVTIPVEKGKLVLGEWQDVVLIDFDEKPRKRELVVEVIKK